MDLIGKSAEHKKFGKGIIKELVDDRIHIEFEGTGEVKKFPYPTCFKTSLKLIESGTAEEADDIIRKYEIDEKKQKDKKYKMTEAKRITQRMHERSQRYSGDNRVERFNSVAEFSRKYIESLQQEIQYIKINGSGSKILSDGKRLNVKSYDEYIYMFTSDEELNYPDDMKVYLGRGAEKITGYIVGCDDFNVIISTSYYLGEEVREIEMRADQTNLLFKLCDRLDKISYNPSRIAKMLICDGEEYIDNSRKILSGQNEAIRMSFEQPVTFIWGPPGTGKTYTLAKIALEHMKCGNRVLMLSHSNISVDGAVMRLNDLAEKSLKGVAVRYGYVRNKELMEHEYLTSFAMALQNNPQLCEEYRNLEASLKGADSNSKYGIKRRLTVIKEKLKRKEKEAVRNARFVATTVSKAVIDKLIYDGNYDIVIFDEASMAYIAHVVFAADIAKKHFVCMGDFRQLPPIVQSEKNDFLSTDIFQYCCITDAVDSGCNHRWLCMLDVQYRMHPAIADFASRLMYSGMIESAESAERNAEKTLRCAPCADNAIVLADLSGMRSMCMKEHGSSAFNILSAMIAFSLAMNGEKNSCNTGIITPYRAQARLLNAMSKDAYATHELNSQITCSTVHQFQGSEKDLIIFDAVECYLMRHMGNMLTEMKRNYANRLFNVALTRAKGKFIGICNVDFMKKKKLQKDLMLRYMIDQYGNDIGSIAGEKLLNECELPENNFMMHYTEEIGKEEFLRDILEAEKEIIIDIPGKINDIHFCRRLANALHRASLSKVRVRIRTEKMSYIPDELRKYAIENRYVKESLAIIDKEIVWYGMPVSAADFQSEGKVIPTLFRPIIRLEGRATARVLYSYVSMSGGGRF